MIVFHPNKHLAIWGNEFEFNNSITLTPKEKTDHKIFTSWNDVAAFVRTKLGNPLVVVEMNQDGAKYNVEANGINVGVATNDYR